MLSPLFSHLVSYEQIVGKCLSVHLKALPVLEKWLHCPVYYTLGWIDDGTSKGLYRFYEEAIADKLANGHHDNNINIHAWLTLPSMEIIDLTLSTSFSVLQGLKTGKGGIMVKKADDITGFAYVPMLVGETYLSKIGALNRVTW